MEKMHKVFVATLACTPMIPAIIINIDAASAQGAAWTIFAVASVVTAAISVEYGRSLSVNGSASTGIAVVLFGAFFAIFNVLNALANASATSDNRSDDRRNAMENARNLRGNLERAREALSQQRKIAGDRDAASIRSEIEVLKAEKSANWKSTNGCNAENITIQDSIAFCKEVRRLESLAASADRRDAESKKIDSLTAKIANMGKTPDRVNPFADRISSLASLAGFSIGDGFQSGVTTIVDVMKALGVELMAAFGPAVIYGRFGGSVPARSSTNPISAPLRNREQKSCSKPAVATATTIAQRFICDRLERCEGSVARFDVVWQEWNDFCSVNGIDPGSKKRLTMTLRGEGLSYDRNNNRPRFLNVVVKPNANVVRLSDRKRVGQ